MSDPTNPEIEPTGSAETAVESVESKPEVLDTAAQMLENPPDGSFILGLQAFIAWANNLLADDDKT